jgi:hypothetical protein
VLARTPPVNAKLAGVFTQLRSLVRQPQTKTSLLRLRETFDQAAPAATFIAPFQTTCNYWNYWFTWLPEHLTQRDDLGTTQRVAIIGAPNGAPDFPTSPLPLPNQPASPLVEAPIGGYSGIASNGKDNAGVFRPHTLPITHGDPYGPAVDSNGNADCQSGQSGYLLGNLRVPGQPANNPVVGVPDIPGDRGPTFAGRSSVPTELHPRSLP